MVDSKSLHIILSKFSRSVVGRLCKQNEIIAEKKSLSENQKLDLLKSFNRELVYEATRDLENQIKCYSMGKNYEKYEIYKPTNAVDKQ